LETIRQHALRRFLFLGLGLAAGLSVGVYEFLKGELPPAGFGIVLVLLMVAFLTGLSLILRAASRQIRRQLVPAPNAAVSASASPAISVLALLRNKPQ
jgi:hypothetical protein